MKEPVRCHVPWTHTFVQVIFLQNIFMALHIFYINILQAKGHDTARHVLACFGGAGGQHACAIARSLGMTQVFVHR